VWERELIVFYSKAEQEDQNWIATYHPDCAIITDCTVQQCNRPLGTFGM
jgi:hypothetical protein